MKAGIYDISEAEYHTGPGESNSALKQLDVSAAHYKAAGKAKQKQTPDMTFGSLYHTAILEPDLLKDKIAHGPDCERRSAADKEEWAKFFKKSEGKIRLNADGYALGEDKYGKIIKSDFSLGTAINMQNVLFADSTLKNMFINSDREKSLYSEDKETGLLKRCRIDVIPHKGDSISDLKTALDASPRGFEKAIRDRQYYVQAAYYLDIAAELGIERDYFAFIAQEKVAPFAYKVHYLSWDYIEEGRRVYRRRLDLLKKCRDENNWPGYDQEINEAEKPSWM